MDFRFATGPCADRSLGTGESRDCGPAPVQTRFGVSAVLRARQRTQTVPVRAVDRVGLRDLQSPDQTSVLAAELAGPSVTWTTGDLTIWIRLQRKPAP